MVMPCRTEGDKQERQTEQLEKRADHPDEIEKKPLILAPKADAPTILTPIDVYELYEQRVGN
jgi:hypothetical protein